MSHQLILKLETCLMITVTAKARNGNLNVKTLIAALFWNIADVSGHIGPTVKSHLTCMRI